MTRAAFLDRDGTLILDAGYLRDPEQIQVLPGVPGALARLRAAGFLLIVVTNQSGVAQGLYGEEDVRRIHDELERQLGRFDAIYHCPHHPFGVVAAYSRTCGCRKPAPGMIAAGIARFGVDVSRSILVGDRESDVAAGAALGLATYRVRTGPSGEGDWDDLDAVARWATRS